jgi:hypothetical protein
MGGAAPFARTACRGGDVDLGGYAVRFVLIATLTAQIVCAARGAQGSGACVLRGVVKDPSGAIVTGAMVTAIRSSSRRDPTAPRVSVTTGSSGEYCFAALPEGSCDFHVIAQGFRIVAVRNLHLSPGSESHMDLTLEPGGGSDSACAYHGSCRPYLSGPEFRTDRDYDEIAARFGASVAKFGAYGAAPGARILLLRDRLPEWITRKLPRSVELVDGERLKKLAGPAGFVRYLRAMRYREFECCLVTELLDTTATNVPPDPNALPNHSYPSVLVFEIAKVDGAWLTPEE